MFKRIFVAIDYGRSTRRLLPFIAEMAKEAGAEVQVFHAVQFAGRGCTAPLEPVDEAQQLVDEAVLELWMMGVAASGTWRPAHLHDVSWLIAEHASSWSADLIVLGTKQGRGLQRLLGRGVRERVILRSKIPVMVAPTAVEARQLDPMTW
jgi:nucleotide-binding universal stress UspA family protein